MFFDSVPDEEQERNTHTHSHYFWLGVLWANFWSSDVFGVAMTLVTIVGQSCSNVEAGGRQGCFGAIHRSFQPKTLTEELQRRQGKRAENKRACVSMKERRRGGEGGEKSGSCGHEF